VKKFIITIFVISLLVITIGALVFVCCPLRNDTAAYSGIISLRKGTVIDFETGFDCAYQISAQLTNKSTDTLFGIIPFVITKTSNSENVFREFNFLQSKQTIVNLGQLKIGTYKLKILDGNDSSNEQSVYLNIDVVGGGPSHSIEINRELRPHVWKIFWIGLALLLVMFFLLIRKFRLGMK
jgi:hypothetical protein